jgi:hypothetical protein
LKPKNNVSLVKEIRTDYSFAKIIFSGRSSIHENKIWLELITGCTSNHHFSRMLRRAVTEIFPAFPAPQIAGHMRNRYRGNISGEIDDFVPCSRGGDLGKPLIIDSVSKQTPMDLISVAFSPIVVIVAAQLTLWLSDPNKSQDNALKSTCPDSRLGKIVWMTNINKL